MSYIFWGSFDRASYLIHARAKEILGELYYTWLIIFGFGEFDVRIFSL